MATTRGGFCLVLHAHLPYVLHHGRWPHGSDWLTEATLDCYLPLLRVFRRLIADGISPRTTVSISPVLAEQLASPSFRKEMDRFFQNRLMSLRQNRQDFTARGEAGLKNLTEYWEEWLRQMRALFDELAGNPLRGFRALEEAGHIEIITCGATHGYFPLISTDASVTLQVAQAVKTHERHFGRRPRGIWIPECSYRPRYEWTPPIGPSRGRTRVQRKGVEEILAEHGIEFFITASHMATGGPSLSAYKDFYPALKDLAESVEVLSSPERARTPYRVYRVASQGGTGEAAVFVRDPQTSLQVWSRERGYPGDGHYLEFHKLHWPGGHRYWRVTDAQADLESKERYDPEKAQECVLAHAEHFTAILTETLADNNEEGPGLLICAPYDAELFGHWWFEGPAWIEAVYRRLPATGITPRLCSEHLKTYPPREVISLLEGSWGEGGDHRVWLNRETEWIWDRIYQAEWELIDFLDGLAAPLRPQLERVLNQILRELLLLQASDWPFLITTQSARDYAERRFAEHYADFKRLMALARSIQVNDEGDPGDEAHLERLEQVDGLFADVNIQRFQPIR